jgi:ABC-type sugar transport system ATPase subunit
MGCSRSCAKQAGGKAIVYISHRMSHHRVSAANTAAPFLELRGVPTPRVHDIHLAVRPGEIVGLPE